MGKKLLYVPKKELKLLVFQMENLRNYIQAL
jgi:hypothetical protein